ncbi:DUF3307 domain-containing protein [Gemmatimonas aurantiaca]|nr:DUF3307 domain-containing protein [Gemmatimonas aurantiaca]
MLDLLWFLLLGHYLGDFALQSDAMARTKGSSKRTLTEHVTIYTLCIAASLGIGLQLSGSDAFVSSITLIVLLVLFAEHWIQDLIKETKFNGSKQAFFVDQGLHVAILFLMRIFVFDG